MNEKTEDLFKRKDLSGKYALVSIPRPIPESLTYEIPNSLEKIQIGSVVEVPFRRSKIEGFIVGFETADKIQSEYEIKPIERYLTETPVFNEDDLKFYKWVSDYYQIPLGEVLGTAFTKSVFIRPSRTVKRKKTEPSESTKPVSFAHTDEQKTAISSIVESVRSSKFKSFLLYGVTGSGKTEVYLNAAKECIAQGKSALILVPEIALTPQLRTRFEEYFGDSVAVLHSSLTEKTRRDFWWDALEGRKKLVVGARSAIFAPLKNIGLIVVDEEHETTYKQEDRLRYNARDLALVRAKHHDATVVLGSATPSIETFYASKSGKHTLLELRERPQSRPMPIIEIIDMKEEHDRKKKTAKENKSPFERVIFSDAMINGVVKTLHRGEQAIIFVNRKGYSSFLLCKDCGDVPECLNCSVSLTYYANSRKLRCHYCGFEDRVPEKCGKCGSSGIKFMGLGTELAYEELEKILKPEFENLTIARLDSDTAPNMKKLEEILQDFRDKKTQILLGTQMLAKGHDFPNVTFIGIVLADLNLHLPDFRSGERTFQLLAQVSGRAGRGSIAGKVILQTYMPDHYVIEAAKEQDYRKFYEREIEERKVFEYPPFSRMAHLEFRNLKEERAQSEARKISNLLDHLLKNKDGVMGSDVTYLGPTAASIGKIANQYRWQILLKSEKFSSLNAVIRTLRKEGVRFIDVDPVSTL